MTLRVLFSFVSQRKEKPQQQEHGRWPFSFVTELADHFCLFYQKMISLALESAAEEEEEAD